MVTRLESREPPARPSPAVSGLLGVVSVLIPLAVVAAFTFVSFDSTWRRAWDATQLALVESGTLPSLVIGLAIVLAGILIGHAVLAAQWARTAPELSQVALDAAGQGEDDLRWALAFRRHLLAGALVRRDGLPLGDPGSANEMPANAGGRGTANPA